MANVGNSDHMIQGVAGVAQIAQPYLTILGMWGNSVLTRFQAADTEKDGKITTWELRAPALAVSRHERGFVPHPAWTERTYSRDKK